LIEVIVGWLGHNMQHKSPPEKPAVNLRRNHPDDETKLTKYVANASFSPLAKRTREGLGAEREFHDARVALLFIVADTAATNSLF